MIPAGEIEERLRARLSPARVEHSLSVAAMARELASCWGQDADKAYRAGLIHDLAKETPNPLLLEKIGKRRNLLDLEKRQPHMLHAEAGAAEALAEGWVEEDVAAAAGAHTLAGPGLSSLAKILFVSDYLEPARRFSAAEGLRGILDRGLETVFRACLKDKIAYCLEKNLALHPLTVAAWNEGRS